MITVQEYLSYIERGEIPPEPPEGTSIMGRKTLIPNAIELIQLRNKCTEEHGVWVLITKQWTKLLSDWISARTCLEVMAGAGWLSKALSENGIDVVATDNYSWQFHKDVGNYVYPVERLDSKSAVLKYSNKDVLITSWPPYSDGAITEVLDIWGSTKPIVYIGEGEGGCTANDDFFLGFSKDHNAPCIPLYCHYGLHDKIMIGYWRKK